MVTHMRRSPLEGVALVARGAPWYLVESVLAAAEGVGFQGAMYTVSGASLSTPSSIGSAPPSTRRLLGAYGRAVHWRVPSWSWSRYEVLIFGRDAALKLGVHPPRRSWSEDVQRRFCCLAVWVVLCSVWRRVCIV